MRLTLYDVARSMVELDGLEESARDRVVLRAKVRHPGDPGCGCIVTFAAVAFVCAIIAPLLAGPLFGVDERVSALFIPLGVLIAGVLALYLRDHELRTMVRAQLQRTRCPACAANLIGSARSSDMVRCRGCGKVHTYESLVLEAEDLGPPLLRLDERACCPRCTYSWAGLSATAAVVTCPECGNDAEVAVPGPPLDRRGH